MKEKTTLNKLLKSTSEKTIYLLGREGIFTNKEIERFFKKYNTKIVSDYTNNISAVIEHNILNPFEEDISNMAYDNSIVSYKLQDLEKLVSKSINDNELLMSIKLTNDSSRVFRLLGNEYISDILFVKLLSMYEWSDEEEDSRKDRDVIMFTLRRYIKIKPNEEDLLYSYLTLRRLATEIEDANLLLVLIKFPNFSFMVRGKEKVTLRETVARNEYIDDKVIYNLISLRDKKVNISLASNINVPLDTLKKFLLKNDKDINKALACNRNIDSSIFKELLNQDSAVIELLLIWQYIDMERLNFIEEKNFEEKLFSLIGANENLNNDVVENIIIKKSKELILNLSQNSTIQPKKLEMIYNMNIEETLPMLAKNSNTPTQILQRLYEKNSTNIDILSSIAYNSSLSTDILYILFQKDNFEINKGLATNLSLPMELLDILKIDTRLQNYLAQNQIFIKEYETVLDYNMQEL